MRTRQCHRIQLARDVHDAMSNITKPSKGILQWVSQSLATAPHPLAGVINIEWSTSPIYIARYKRDANTILPGYLYIDDGALHFVCTLVTNDRDRVIFSTQTAAELRFPNDTVDTTFEPLLGSELAAIELLISAPSQFPLYKEVQWSHPDHLGACSPLVMNITTAGPIRLAWCLGNSGVYLGTHVENTNFASYYEPGPDDVDSKHTIAKSFKFWLLTGQQHQYKQFESNCSAPHPALEWQRQRQGNFKDVTVVQFASSGGNMVVVQPRGTSSNLGLDFVTTGTDTALIVLVKLNNTVARRDINGRITLDEISSEGDTTALNWWFEVDLPPVYSTKAVDESSANNHTKTLDWWFNFSTDNNMPFHFTDAAVDKAAEKGSLDSLKWWFGKYGTTMRFSRAAIDGAIGNGQLDVIRWWVDNGLPFQPTPYALNQASKNGHVDFFATWHSKLLDLDFNANSTTCMDYATSGRQTLVLDWFKDHAPDSYSANAVHWAAKAGHTDMLQWWLDSGLPLKYLDTTYQEAHYDAQVWWHEIGFSKLPRNPVPGNAGHQLPRTPVLNNKAIKKEELAIDRASRANRVTTLKELLKARPLGRYSANAVDYASANGHLDVLKIWKSSGCAMVYTQRAMDFASARGHLEVLSWWMMSGLELLYSKAAMDKASGRIESNGVQSEQVSIAVLDWWLASGLPILYSASAMINSSQAGFVDVLSWWSVHKFRIYFRDKALIQASRHGRIRALEWWRDNGFDLKVCRDVCIAEATSAGQEEVVVWWQSAVSLHELCP
ncbi:hypothetical protein BC828DRAFT_40554 [Blastocladiella britannica]|nr:hypothetical protein BC828DRAFT_40554 [Blastocladiella britannica]